MKQMVMEDRFPFNLIHKTSHIEKALMALSFSTLHQSSLSHKLHNPKTPPPIFRHHHLPPPVSSLPTSRFLKIPSHNSSFPHLLHSTSSANSTKQNSPAKFAGLKPPASKEEAVSQARNALVAALSKPLNNPGLTGKVKKPRQPRFQIEIPVNDDSPEAIVSLAGNLFGSLQLKRKGQQAKILLIWSDSELQNVSDQKTRYKLVKNSVIGGSMEGDVAVLVGPETTRLREVESFCNRFSPKPVVILNPQWGSQEEESGLGNFSGLVGSFEVLYSFMGLEVKGILSKRQGVVFRCAKDGIPSNGAWEVFVEEENNTETKAVMQFKKRPEIGEVENVLYNLMAANSPVTKSVKFMRDLVSRVTKKKS